MLSQYYWETIDACVPPETIMDVLRRSGFVGVERTVFGGFLSEYVAVKAPAVAGQRIASSAGSTPRRP
jgi:demethylmenaquinone methyltransferase / 2-methoxy-6-polyprenyl-1,4-benzoquinol methylase